MTPAERKFSGVEGGLTRARCIVRVLRELTSTSLLTDTDPVFRDGIYVMIAEADQALDAALDVWNEAHDLASGECKP